MLAVKIVIVCMINLPPAFSLPNLKSTILNLQSIPYLCTHEI
jgi:hypothetical protein